MENSVKIYESSNQLGFVADALSNLQNAKAYADGLVASKILPKHYYGEGMVPKPGASEAVLLVVQAGKEVGMSILNAIQQIVPVNNTLTIKGDGAKALIMASKLCSKWKEEEVGTGDDWGIKITAQRKDTGEEKISTFTISDAKRAGLWITDEQAAKTEKLKYSPWYKYGKRMLRYRSLGFICRDLFPDVLQGIYVFEEVEDYERESLRVELGNGMTANVDTTKQEAMVVDAIAKVGRKGTKAAKSVEPEPEYAYAEVVPDGGESVNKGKKSTVAEDKPEPPTQENPPAIDKDTMSDEQKINSVQSAKLVEFIGKNKKMILDYLDIKFKEVGFDGFNHWIEITRTPRTISNVSEIVDYMRNGQYQKMCMDKFGKMVPLESKGGDAPEIMAPPKKESSPTQGPLKTKFIIPEPPRDFDAQILVMEYVHEAGKSTQLMGEFAKSSGYINTQSFLESCSVSEMDDFLSK